jgi:hypothetical protein
LNKMNEATTPQGSPGTTQDTTPGRLAVEQAHKLSEAEVNRALIQRGLHAKADVRNEYEDLWHPFEHKTGTKRHDWRRLRTRRRPPKP